MDAEFGGCLQIPKHSSRGGQMHFKRLNVVSAQSSDTEGNVRSASKCRVHQGADDRQVLLSIGGLVFALGVGKIHLMVKRRPC